MALTNEQVREILSAAGVDEDHMKTAAEKIISGHLESVNALRLDVEKYRVDAEKLPGVAQELETLKKSSGDAADIQKQLTDLQAKYDKDTGDLRAQLADRDYADAISKAIAGKGLKFSSKSARCAFETALREKKLELKDGTLTGLDEFIKAQKEADPDAFAPDKAPPRFVTGSGSGGGHGEPPENVPENVRIAKEMGAARAASAGATNDVLKNYL